MRRSARFGGQDAAFDSNSCLSRHETDVDFEIGSPRWQGPIHGRVNPQIWAAAHENLHWAQYIGTGFGSFLNLLRSERDRNIILALAQLPDASERISSRLAPTVTKPIFDYDVIRAKVLKSCAPAEPIEWAIAYDFLERCVYVEDASKHWFHDNVLLDRTVRRLTSGNDAPVDVSNGHPSPSTLITTWPVFEEPISTEQLQEAQAVLFEFFYLSNFGRPGEDWSRRFEALQTTFYNAPVYYLAAATAAASCAAQAQQREAEPASTVCVIGGGAPYTYSNNGSPCVASTVIQFGQRGGWFGLW